MKQTGLRVRGWGFAGLIWTGCLLAISVTAGAARGNDGVSEGLRINVRIYNYAQVPNEILAGAETDAGGIYRAAGVEITWITCYPARANHDETAECNQLMRPTNLGVRIIPYFGVTPGITKRTMGLAVGDLATVAVRRVREEAAEFGVQPCDVLGPAIAHEIGHLLLGSQGHSPTGIMRARWRREDYERAPRGAFKFTAQQAEQIRAEVKKRFQAESPTEVAPVTATK